MSVRRIKVWMMWATCLGLVGAVATDVHAFGKKNACDDPCANPCDSGRGGLFDLFGKRKAKSGNADCNPCGPYAGAYGGYGGPCDTPCAPAVPAAPVAPA